MNDYVVKEPSSRTLHRSWGWMLALGILFVILGAIGLGMVVGLTLVSMLFFGFLLLIAGVSQLIDTARSRHWKAVLWHAFIAVLYILGGILVIYDPFLASSILTMFLAAVLIVIGISRLMMAFSLEGFSGRGWLFLAGLISLILGIMIWLQWPISGLWVIGLFIAIEIMVVGWTYIFMAFALRQV